MISARMTPADSRDPDLAARASLRRHKAVATGLVAGMAGRHGDAWALREEITRASAADFGPPAWHPLVLPGWG